jgi:hypothetical protein
VDAAKNWKGSLLAEQDIVHMSFMTKNLKAVAFSITKCFPSRYASNPLLRYQSVMDARGFNPEALMVSLRHLFDNRAQGKQLCSDGRRPHDTLVHDLPF